MADQAGANCATEALPANVPMLRRDPRAVKTLDELREVLDRRIYAAIARAGYDAPPPVLTARPAPLELRQTDRGTTLTAADYEHDPLIAQDRGRLRAPKPERQKLKRLRRAGIDPDYVWVLRELPGIWRPGQSPPRMIGLTAAETARTRHLQHLQVGAAAFAVGRAMLYTAVATAALAAGAAVAVGAITIAGVGAVAVAPLADGLDPLILAGIEHPRTGAVAWTPIAAWDEIPDERAW